jgi:hypothetical protein
VCVREITREKEFVCVIARERVRASEYVRERERERERKCMCMCNREKECGYV